MNEHQRRDERAPRAAEQEREHDQSHERRRPGRRDEEGAERLDPVLDDEVAGRVRQVAEEERAGVLDVVEPPLDVDAKPVLRRPARPDGAGAEDVAERGRKDDRHHAGGGVQAQNAGLLRGQVPLRRIGAVCHRLGRAVEGDRHDHDRGAREDREGGVGVEAVRDGVTKPRAADQAGNHDHRKREQDRLIHREEKHPPRERKLHLRQHLPPCCPESSRRLDGVRRDAADTE